MKSEKLYTPELLAAAMDLAGFPPLEEATWHGSARSSACGSTLDIDLDIDEHDAISRLGMRVRACAVGQASAALFARHAVGLSAEKLNVFHNMLDDWLRHGGTLPQWPGLELIEPAQAYPARHGAMLLPWKAALAALSTSPASS